MNLLNKILLVISPQIKVKSIILLFFIIVTSFLDLLSIGLVLPVVSTLITGEGNLISNFIENISFSLSSSLEVKESFNEIFSLAALLLTFFLKFIFMCIFIFFHSQFVAQATTEISSNIIKKYIYNNYNFFLIRNSSELIRNLTSEVAGIIKKILIPIIYLILDCIIFLGIIFLLFFVSPKSSLILFSGSILIILIYYLISKKKLYFLGLDNRKLEKNKINLVQNLFNGIQLIKLYNKEENFVESFKHTVSSQANNLKIQTIIMSIPRYFTEFLIIFIFIIFLILQLNSRENNLISVVPIISIYVVAAARLFPTINRMILNLQSLKSGQASIENISKELSMNYEREKFIDKKNIVFKNKINISNLSFKYPSGNDYIFKNLNIDIAKNEIIGISGSSGIGKTTFINILTGLIKPTEGEVKVDDENINDFMKSWRNMIGYVSQSNFLIDTSIRENITYFSKHEKTNNKLLDKVILQTGLEDLVSKRSSSGVDTKIGEMGLEISGGQKQRICLARCLYSNPDILILDESTNALDSESEKNIFKNIINDNDKRRTIILISHKSTNFKYCEKIYEIKKGKFEKID